MQQVLRAKSDDSRYKMISLTPSDASSLICERVRMSLRYLGLSIVRDLLNGSNVECRSGQSWRLSAMVKLFFNAF